MQNSLILTNIFQSVNTLLSGCVFEHSEVSYSLSFAWGFTEHDTTHSCTNLPLIQLWLVHLFWPVQLPSLTYHNHVSYCITDFKFTVFFYSRGVKKLCKYLFIFICTVNLEIELTRFDNIEFRYVFLIYILQKYQ